jgi:hypothetical protein
VNIIVVAVLVVAMVVPVISVCFYFSEILSRAIHPVMAIRLQVPLWVWLEVTVEGPSF